ncbi:hypothetical protein PIB30_063602 [Stylosanthes scabra]|uniref:Uncharacterized protein n=1 Tax=Stylosanthes scabra TaxID=79078 RepID=A0ABU6VKQ6_9FABA|nr:hypothetical protein [Stylosanthes scabra]
MRRRRAGDDELEEQNGGAAGTTGGDEQNGAAMRWLFKRFNIIDNTINAVAGEGQITTEKIGKAFGLKYTGTTYPKKVNTKELSEEDERICKFF